MTTLHTPPTQTRQNPALRSLLPAGLALVVLVLVGTLSAPLTPEAYAANDQLSKAIEEQRSLIDYDSQSPELYNDLGNLLTLDQQWRAAEEAYRAALILDAEHAPAAFNLALLLQREGQDDEALTLLEGVAVVMPEHAWAHYQRGRILQSKGKRREAVEAYATAFAADPELTFSDVNPHLVGNELATEALLRIDESKIPISPDNAPRTYADAQRIVDLLVPSAEIEAPSDSSSATGDQAISSDASSDERATEVLSSDSLRGGTGGVTEPQAERTDSPTRVRPLSVEEAARQNSSRNVNREDLEDLGSFNQASPQTGTSRPGAASRPRPAGPRGVPIVPRTMAPQAQPGAQPNGGQEPGAQPGTPPINRTAPRTPAQPGRFLPGSRSSAQLERQIERIAPSP